MLYIMLWALLLAPVLTNGQTDSVRSSSGSSGTDVLDLKGLLEIALEHDGRVLSAYADMDAYRSKFDRARWAWFPAIKLRALFGGPLGQRKLACPDDPNCVRLENTEGTGLGDLSTQVSFAVGGRIEAAVPIYTFGKLDALKSAAKAGIVAGKADIYRARQQVAMEVRKAWYAWLLANEAVDILEDGEKKIHDAEKKLIKMLDELNEDVTDRDLFKLRYYSAQVHEMLLEAKKGRKMAVQALGFLTGRKQLSAAGLAVPDLSKPKLKLEDRSRYSAMAEQNRPELKMLNAALNASRAKVEGMKASFYPDIFIGGYFEGSYSPAHDYIENSLLNHGMTYYSGGLSLGMQITLDIPQKLAQLEQSQAELRSLEAKVQQAHAAVELEISKEYLGVQTAKDYLKAYKKAHSAAKAWMRTNLMSYGVGISNTKDLLDSIAAYAQSEMAFDKAIHDFLVAYDRLRLAAGLDLGKLN